MSAPGPGVDTEFMRSAYLTNQLLVAMPALADPNFSQAVTLICEHTDKGALGIVLNKPLGMALGDVFRQLTLESTDLRAANSRFCAAARCSRTAASCCTRPRPERPEPWDSTLKSFPDAERDDLARRIWARWPAAPGAHAGRLVALGYAGWEAGQLEDEIRSNAWLTMPINELDHLRDAVRAALAGGRAARWHRSRAALGRRSCLRPGPAAALGPPGQHPQPGSPSGFDYGERRIGVAAGDTLTGGARPLGVVAASAVAPTGRRSPAYCATDGAGRPRRRRPL